MKKTIILFILALLVFTSCGENNKTTSNLETSSLQNSHTQITSSQIQPSQSETSENETSEPETSSLQNVESSPAITEGDFWQGDELYAVAYLGYGVENPMQSAKEYISFDGELPIAQTAGDEWYLIILRYSDTEVSVSPLDLSESFVVGEEILHIDNGKSFLIRCNVSDIMPNIYIQLKSSQGEVDFSPFISLKGDGELVAGIEKGIDITLK